MENRRVGENAEIDVTGGEIQRKRDRVRDEGADACFLHSPR